MPDKENMTSLDRIDVIGRLLDALVEAKGREKAGYISVINDFLEHIRDDLLIKEECLKELEKEKIKGNTDGSEKDKT